MEIRDVMTADPIVCAADCHIKEAATAMRDRNVGDVIVKDDGGQPCGIVTDRDLVVRGLATEADLDALTLGDVCDRQLHTVRIDADVSDVIKLMQDKTIRRVPVMDDGKLAGIISLGDLAAKLDAQSVLGTISGAPPDR